MAPYYIQLARHLTAKRVFNLLKLAASFTWSRLTGRAVIWGRPASVSIEPGTACNLRCPQCPSGLRQFTRDTGMLTVSLFTSLVDQLKGDLLTLTLYFQGEPYLNKNLLAMAKIASERNIFTITSTNGHYLDEETARETVLSGLGKLIISIDGVTQETYGAYRKGGQLEKVLSGTRAILSERKMLKRSTPRIVWQFVAFSHNEHEIPALKILAKETGVDEVAIKTAQIYDFEHGDTLMPVAAELSRYEKNESGQYRIKNALANRCWRMWRGCVITWDGKVVPCCFDKDASHQLGSAADVPFISIWRSDRYRKFRESVLTSRKSVDICTNCSEGTKVWA